jgi:heat shock protein HslJ
MLYTSIRSFARLVISRMHAVAVPGAVLAAALLGACTGLPSLQPTSTPGPVDVVTETPSEAPLTDTSSPVGPTWQIVAYNRGDGTLVPPVTGSEISLLFGSEDVLSGVAGCNDYSASYEVDATALTIAPPVATRKTCDEPAGVMEQEAAYLAALSTTAAFTIRGEQLTLHDRRGAVAVSAVVATSEKSDPGTAASSNGKVTAEGKTWLLAAYTDSEGQMVAPLPDTRITLVLDNSRFTGSAGCNTYNGQYELNGNQVSIQLGATTMMACAEPIMAQERAYLTALSQAVAYRAAVDRLELLDIGGRQILSYRAQ